MKKYKEFLRYPTYSEIHNLKELLKRDILIETIKDSTEYFGVVGTITDVIDNKLLKGTWGNFLINIDTDSFKIKEEQLYKYCDLL